MTSESAFLGIKHLDCHNDLISSYCILILRCERRINFKFIQRVKRLVNKIPFAATDMSFALVFMTCLYMLYRGKYDLFVTVYYYLSSLLLQKAHLGLNNFAKVLFRYDLANKIPFVVDLILFLLVIMTCVYVSFIPANLASLITVFYLSLLL